MFVCVEWEGKGRGGEKGKYWLTTTWPLTLQSQTSALVAILFLRLTQSCELCELIAAGESGDPTPVKKREEREWLVKKNSKD